MSGDMPISEGDRNLAEQIARKGASSKARYPLDYTITRAIKQFPLV
jgi:hypothetical protein